MIMKDDQLKKKKKLRPSHSCGVISQKTNAPNNVLFYLLSRYQEGNRVK